MLYRMWKRYGCYRLVWWHVAFTSQFCSVKSQPGSRIDEEQIKLMVRWNSSNHIPNIRQAAPGIHFISIEPPSRIRVKNIRKCSVQSNPHERITPPSLRKKTLNSRIDRIEYKTRKKRFHADLFWGNHS